MQEPHERIKAARKAKGYTQADVRRRLGVSNATVSEWESGKTRPRGENLYRLAKLLDVTAEWILTGKEPRHSTVSNVTDAPEPRGEIPLISWVQAGTLSEAIDIYAVGDAEQWLPCPTNHGPRTFALRVCGDSMTSYHGTRSYPDGVIIYVDPDKSVTNGCRVVAKRIDTNEVTFKQFVDDAGRKYLKPLNPQYPIIEIDGNFTIIGVVIASYAPE